MPMLLTLSDSHRRLQGTIVDASCPRWMSISYLISLIIKSSPQSTWWERCQESRRAYRRVCVLCVYMCVRACMCVNLRSRLHFTSHNVCTLHPGYKWALHLINLTINPTRGYYRWWQLTSQFRWSFFTALIYAFYTRHSRSGRDARALGRGCTWLRFSILSRINPSRVKQIYQTSKSPRAVKRKQYTWMGWMRYACFMLSCLTRDPL